MEVTVAPWEGDNAAPSQSTGRTFLVSLTDVTDRKLREDEQARSVERYRRLLREMSHRIKNNLQVLSSIVEIERGSGATGESFRRIAERIRNVSRVHNALYEATTEVDRIDLAETLLDFIRQYRGGLPHNVELTYEPPDRPLHTDSLYGLSVSLAVNELLTNAVQHAFPDGRRGHISVSLGKHKEGVVLIVSDDGVGMTDKGAHGSGDTARGGVGTLLVGQLLDEIGARWTRTSEDGVRHEITFQLQ
jgi:two-component sensor histidine kinase